MSWQCQCRAVHTVPEFPLQCIACGWHFVSSDDPGTPPKCSDARGLGDVVAWTAARLGIGKHRRCKCKKRQRILNRLMPLPLGWARSHEPADQKDHQPDDDS